MEDNVASAEELITKWPPDGSSAKITSLFHGSHGEARRFLLAVHDLHEAMCFFSGASSTLKSSDNHLLVRGQRLMETAMTRLRWEFHQILAANGDRLDPDSVSSVNSLSTVTRSPSFSDLEEEHLSEAEEIKAAGENVEQAARPPTDVMVDLRAIAHCMVSCGYASECVAAYKSVRRSIVDDGLYRLGFDRLSTSHIKKPDYDSLDRQVTKWLAASSVAVRTLFSGERALCDFVFGSSAATREPCFADVTRDAAVQFLGFPKLAVLSAKGKRNPEKLFQFLDMYSSIAELRPEIEELFSYGSTETVRSQARLTQQKLGEHVRASLTDFEATLQRDSSKETVPGGAIHPLTQHAMDYMVRLADYGGALVQIYANSPVTKLHDSLPKPLFQCFIQPSPVPSFTSSSAIYEEDLDASPGVPAQLAWMLLVLLCKLDCKADLYRDPALAYLFLANNLHYVLSNVRLSKLSRLLGREWVEKQAGKARSFAWGFERLAWSGVLESIPRDPAALLELEGVEAARACMKRFNKEFVAAYRKQAEWVVMDRKTRKELRDSIAMKVVEPYGVFYEQCREVLGADRDSIGVVRFAPVDVGSYLAHLFREGGGSPASGSASPSASPGSGPARGGSYSSTGCRWRRLGLLCFTR